MIILTDRVQIPTAPILQKECINKSEGARELKRKEVISPFHTSFH